MKRLIINADDFGMTLAISRGILKCAAAGAVRATSAMANSPDFDASMDEIISSHVHPDIGFHATLTWGRPVSDPKDVPTLVDDEGDFLSRKALLLRALIGKISADEAYKELRAQCMRLARRWPEMTHMDGHHHVHAFPVICDAAARVAREFGIRFVRAPREGLWSPWHRAAMRRGVVALLPASSPAYWRARGLLATDHFGGFALGACKNLKSRWMEIFGRLPDGTTEIMVHPGFASEKSDSCYTGREEELAVLADPALAEAARAAGVEIVSFREISF